ncbi:hypothetical protein HJB67_12935 [Rhizobium lentis]|uniref:hypothetical protein n=1 Tax=Rhizobium lentis TaxID=1138194 RepID=UPI001C82E833|nr:hypothetical protein [Rhizobium lentis]MBX5010860.1 hypothetical protein [Rhizobium lentis]
MEKQYPIAVKLEVYITDGDQIGSVNYCFGFGRPPSDEDMTTVLAKVKDALPDGFRLMNRAEATMHYLREERGYRGPNMVIPRDGEWHDPETDVDFSSLNNEPEDEDDQY